MDKLKLGVQGTLLTAGKSFNGPNLPPNELDYILNDILHPSDKINEETIISYLAHYYPKIKNGSNVELLTRAFLKCPLFFNDFNVDFNKQHRIVECFKYLMDTKFQISIPTLSFYDFYSAMYEGVRQTVAVDSESFWKILPLVTGCLLSKSSRSAFNAFPPRSHSIATIDQYFKEVLLSSLKGMFSLNAPYNAHVLAVTCLASVHDQLDQSCYGEFIRLKPDLPEFTISLLLNSPYGLHSGEIFFKVTDLDVLMKESPVLRQLNRFAFLFNKLMQNYPNHLSLSVLANIIRMMEDYSLKITSGSNSKSLESLIASNKWTLVKFNYFAFVIIFDGITTKILNSLNKPTSESYFINKTILMCLFHLSTILERIGSGGFESYNFVYETNTSILVKYRQTDLAKSFIEDLLYLQNSTSKLDFTLQIIESFLVILNPAFIKSSILPLVHNLLNQNDSPKVIEMAHSIMLKYLSSLYDPKDNSLSNENLVLYISFTLNQFPNKISFSQCCDILSRAILCINERDLSDLLDIIQARASVTDFSPLPLRSININGEKQQLPEKFLTRRAAIIGILISLVHFVPLPLLNMRLNRIKLLIDGCIGEMDIATLYSSLWDEMLYCNKYFPEKGQLVLAWWYDNVNNGSVPKL